MVGAGEILREKGIGLDDILHDIAYELARTRGKERVQESVDIGAVDNKPLSHGSDHMAEMLSYPVARMIVSCSGDDHLKRRYALGEAMLLEARLLAEDVNTLIEMGTELGIQIVRSDDGEMMIHFTDFLSAAASIRAKQWKLVNQEIFDGMVRLSQERMARVLRQRLNDRIIEELPRPVSDEIMTVLGEAAKSLSAQLHAKRKEFVSGELGAVDDTCFPPCMKTILTMMRAGENIPHSGRFAITSFLHTIGMNSEQIIELFSTAPDFDASKSEYQVRHIVGEISGTEYTPPECSTMRSYGVCYNPDDLCGREWMTHPLKYYGNRKRRKSRSKGAPHPREPLHGSDVPGDDEDDEHDVDKADADAG